MIDKEQVEKILKEKLEATDVEVIDDGHKHFGHQPGDPGYFTVLVKSPKFAGQSRIRQHKLVYDCLRDELKEKIHALSIKTSVS